MDFPDPEPECFVHDGKEFVLEAGSYLEAHQFINAVHDHQELVGESLTPFSVIPCVVSPGGRDLR